MEKFHETFLDEKIAEIFNLSFSAQFHGSPQLDSFFRRRFNQCRY